MRLRASAVLISRALLTVAILASAGVAGAQDREADAERLFREGQKLMEERRFGDACPKFEAAYRKDEKLGTLLNLAFCHKEQGNIWYAWLEFREAEVKAGELGRKENRDFAHARLVELEKQLLKVVIDNPRHVPLSDVLMEDRKVPEAEKGTPFAAEGGQRKITFRARGKRPATTLVNVTRSDRPQRVTVPAMEDLPPEDQAPPDTRPREGGSRPDPGPAGKDDGTGSTQRTLGWVSVGIGAAGLVVMSVAGLMTLGSSCSPGGGGCTADERDSASSTGAVATVGAVVGGAGVLGGAILLLTAPSSGSASTGALPGHAHVPVREVTVTPRLGPGWAGVTGTF